MSDKRFPNEDVLYVEHGALNLGIKFFNRIDRPRMYQM